MFSGFTDKSFEFLMAISFNNNREFFADNHAWYVNSVREPLKELAYELADTIEQIDPELERRPEKVVSRLNRDLRFSKDKSPYRDHMWIGYHAQRDDKHYRPEFYFALTPYEAFCGMGFYLENREVMDIHRQWLLNHPDGMEVLVPKGFDFEMTCYKRMSVPEELSPEGKRWYPLKHFAAEHRIDDFSLLGNAALVSYIKESFLELTPLYAHFARIAAQAQPVHTP